ncbi:MAG: glycosyltransferase family 4 protein [Gammaproteobacteria bacterium]|nr:glycosyltransferase family 4 protein [Gammaproteobacteria bacterium]
MVKKGKKINCLFLLDNLGVGGSERKTIVAANLLAKRGYQVHLAFLNLNYDIANTINPIINIVNLQRKSKVDRNSLRIIKEYIEHNKIDVIWAVNLYPMLYAYLSTRNIKSIRVYGSSNVSVFRNIYERLKMLVYIPVIRRLNGFVFGSVNQMQEWMRKYPLGNGNYIVIHNGVDIEKFTKQGLFSKSSHAKKTLGLPEDSLVVGMVAQFRVEKAHPDLIEAVKRIMDAGNNISVVLVGDGGTQEEIKTIVKESGIEDRVVFSGMMEDVRPALAAMDVFVLTSRAVETFSNAALEAMSMGLPVILSDLAGAREMVDEGINGFTYPPGDVDSLVNCLAKLMDDRLRESMALNAKRIVEERFSSEHMADNYEKIINISN